MNALDKLFSNISPDIAEDVDLLTVNGHTITQIAPTRSDKFLKLYLKNYKAVHMANGQFAASGNDILTIYNDDELHKYNSIYLVVKRSGRPIATLKGTKRINIPFRTETDFNFDIEKYLESPITDLSVWHHSKTSVDKSAFNTDERPLIKVVLKLLYYVLYTKISADRCNMLLGEVNDLNYRSMESNGIKMEVVGQSLQTIGMPAYPVVITNKSIRYFLDNTDIEKLIHDLQ